MTGVSKGGKPMKKRGGLQERSLTGWGSRPLTATSLGTLSLWNFVLLASLFDDATFSWFGLPLTSLYYKTCTVLLRTTKHTQSTSQYYFVIQSLHKRDFPLLLRTTKLTRSTSQYYFVIQSLHKKEFPLLLRTTKLAQRYFPVLLCTTRLAQSTSRWYGHVMMLWLRGWC